MSPPLAGVRVLDLSSKIAGPGCTKLLADAGAEVLKIESPPGDPLRSWSASGRALAPCEDGVLFRFLNTSKRSAVIDEASASGCEQIAGLAAAADIVIESTPFGSAPNTRAALLQERDPRLAIVSISAFGTSGPWSGRAATEFT